MYPCLFLSFATTLCSSWCMDAVLSRDLLFHLPCCLILDRHRTPEETAAVEEVLALLAALTDAFVAAAREKDKDGAAHASDAAGATGGAGTAVVAVAAGGYDEDGKYPFGLWPLGAPEVLLAVMKVRHPTYRTAELVIIV